MSTIVDEVLGAVLAPSRRYDVLREALELAELGSLPSSPNSVRMFVEGPLFSALSRHLQVSDALELVSQIRASLELALDTSGSASPSSAVRERIAIDSPPSRALVVTSASLVVFLLADVLEEHVEVAPVGDLSELKDRLRRQGGAPALVVIDRKHASVDMSVCALLAQELDSRSTVIWWGASAAEQNEATRLLCSGPRVIACDFDLRLSDLGELCRQLLAEPALRLA